MTGRLELEIIDIFSRDITGAFSINEISKKLHKSYPNINHKVNSMIGENVLSKKIIGRSYLCSVNLENDKAILLMSLNEVEKRQKLLKKDNDKEPLLRLIREIIKTFKVHTVFLRDNNELYFVLDHIFDKEAIKKSFPQIRKYRPAFIDLKSFQEKDIQNPLILHSPQDFYGLISRRAR